MVSVRLALTAVALFALLASYPTAAPEFSDWSPPENLGPVVNSAFADQAPAVSKDGLSLYFHSNRPGGFGAPNTPGANDIWVSRRNDAGDTWGLPENLGSVVNSARIESRPALSRDGHWLFFASNRERNGVFIPGLEIWASYREHVHDDFAWQTPIHLGSDLNSTGEDFSPSFFENDDVGIPLLFFSSTRLGGGNFNIFTSALQPDGQWGVPALVPELSSDLQDLAASVRFDGLEVFITRGTPPANFDLWVSTRATVFDAWSPPENLGPVVNSATSDEAPHIAADRRTLFFESTRAGGNGGRDLWVTTRTRK
jgi:hypothetical protein